MVEEHKKLLIIEDDEGLIKLIQRKIKLNEYELSFARSGEEAISKVYSECPTLIILDYMLPDTTGMEIIEILAKQKIYIPFIMMTGHGDEKIAVEIMKRGAYDYIIKDVNFLEILPSVINRAIDKIEIENKLIITNKNLLESEERYRTLVDHSPLAICLFCNNKIDYINPVGLKIFNATSISEIYDKSPLDSIHDDFKTFVLERMTALLNDNIPVPPTEVKLFKTDGTIFDAEVIAIPSSYRNRKAVQIVIQDITERKRLELILREDKEKYRTLFEGSSDGIIILNDKIIDCNDKICKMLGYSRKELIGLFIGQISPKYQPNGKLSSQASDEKIKLAHKGISQLFYWQHIKKDGAFIDMEISLTSMIIKGESVIQVTLRDISERIRIEKELKESKDAIAEEKEMLSVTLRSIGDGVIATDIAGKIVILNRIAETLTGYSSEEAVGRDLIEIFNAIDIKSSRRLFDPFEKLLTMRNGNGMDIRAILIDRNHNQRLIINSIAPIKEKNNNIIGFVLVFRDITEKQKMEEEIIKNQKLESIGILAGGIAHDFNNILTGIIGNISLAKLRSAPDDRVFERLVEAEKAGLRAKDLTQQLLTFSKGGAPIKKAAYIDEIIKDSVNFSIHGSNVVCQYDLPDDLWTVEVDVGQINQVLNNLTINAVQSMPMGGILNISARNIITEDERHYPYFPGKYVMISIEDHGIGIPKEHLNKIFDPFFTTKQKGSGLGLATTYSIIQKHNGFVFVESEVEIGTTFYIFLPAINALPMKSIHEENVQIKTRGKILLMDDDEIIRDIAKEIFTELGFEIDFTKDGLETIIQYRKKNFMYDFVILDLTIPGGLGGKETIKKLIEIHPEVSALVSSGYSNDPVMSDYEEYGFKGVIIKPYNLEEVKRALSKIYNKN